MDRGEPADPVVRLAGGLVAVGVERLVPAGRDEKQQQGREEDAEVKMQPSEELHHRERTGGRPYSGTGMKIFWPTKIWLGSSLGFAFMTISLVTFTPAL